MSVPSSPPVRVDKALGLLPDLEALAPLRDLLVSIARPDERALWSSSGPYLTLGMRGVQPDELTRRMPQAFHRITEHLQGLYKAYVTALECEQRGDGAGVARALLHAGRLEEGVGRLSQARAWFDVARSVSETLQDRRPEVESLRALGQLSLAIGDYAEGARHGAPAATQVADRFHLIQNLAEALTEVFTTQRTALDAVNAAARQQPVPLPDGTVAVPVPPPATPPRAQQQAAQRAAQRQATYDQVWALHRQGWTVPAIAAQVGHSRHTIERYLRLPTWPLPQHRSTYGRSVLNPYKAYLLERWNAGCRTAMQLFRELQPRGYTGSYRRVAAYASRLRQAQGLAPRRQGRRQTLPVVAEPASPPLTPRRATWLVLGRKDKRTEAETQQLTQLHAQDTAVAEAIDLAQDFAQLVRQRQPEHLDPWLQRAATSTLEALRRFATGLWDDYQAVKAGVTLPWSNGPVEGHINRLKMLKRQMFGRAHLDLLRRRFVGIPRDGSAQTACPRAPAQTHVEAASPRGPPEVGRSVMASVLGRSPAMPCGVAGHRSATRAHVHHVGEAPA